MTWQQTKPSWVKVVITGLEAHRTYAAVVTPTATKGGAPAGPSARIDFVTS